eukprot:TRINITY_DN32902_c0_g1_i1.p2 TRINITY_DN32902_c0_g1~~TRINITY_DN32902_c0_g1_i1.p2  ORF type:complete len:640 (+),score=136.23 TRINITY_DN32902_c0_g1_i1:84-1922(+)
MQGTLAGSAAEPSLGRAAPEREAEAALRGRIAAAEGAARALLQRQEQEWRSRAGPLDPAHLLPAASEIVRAVASDGAAACFSLPLLRQLYPDAPFTAHLAASVLACSAHSLVVVHRWVTERCIAPGGGAEDCCVAADVAEALGLPDLAHALRRRAEHPAVSTARVRQLACTPPVLLPGAGLGGADLRGVRLPGAVLAESDLCRASLCGAHLSGSVLDAACLLRADLGCATLERASLRGADLRGCSAGGAVFSDAVLDGAWVGGCDFGGAELSDCSLGGVVGLAQASLARAVLRGASLAGADLRGADLTAADLSGANLEGAQLSGAVLRDAVLNGSVLRRADLRGCRLSDAVSADAADLRGAVCDGGSLAGARLRGADLREVALPCPGALSGCDLGEADLRGADLSGAVLSGCELDGAQLSGCRLDGAAAPQAYVSAVRVRVVVTSPGGFGVRRVAIRRAGGGSVRDEALLQAAASSETRGHGPRSLLGGSSLWLPSGKGPQWAVVLLAYPVRADRVSIRWAGGAGRVEGLDLWHLPLQPGGWATVARGAQCSGVEMQLSQDGVAWPPAELSRRGSAVSAASLPVRRYSTAVVDDVEEEEEAPTEGRAQICVF